MTLRRIHRVFVLDRVGRIDGVITSMDVLQWLERMYRVRSGAGPAARA